MHVEVLVPSLRSELTYGPLVLYHNNPEGISIIRNNCRDE